MPCLRHQSSRRFYSAAGSDFRPTARGAHGGPISAPLAPSYHFNMERGRRGATRCVTPRQTCPRPEGFGRNLRSKTRWFTGFCNSHQVSHFATFFIDARAEISVAESRYDILIDGRSPARTADGVRGADASFLFSLAHSAPGFVSPHDATRGRTPAGIRWLDGGLPPRLATRR